MGDLFLHLPFARRLRFAEGLHPIAAEAMVRRAPAVVLGAALPFLPEIERNRANWFRRLFMGGAQEAAKWRKQLENRDGPPRSEFVIALLSGVEGGANAPGPMTRLAFGIGAMSTEILSVSIEPVLTGLDGSQRDAVTGALARLWLQKTMPNLNGLPAEWRPTQRLQESENIKPLLGHLEAAMKTAFGDSPGRDALQRWVKSLSTEMHPLLQTGGLPPETSIPLHEVESKYFNGDEKFLVRAQEALTRTVYLANRVAECFLGQDATKAQLSDALTEQAGALRDVPSNDVLDGVATKWKSRVADVREDALHRGRNPEAAFKEGEDGLLEGLPNLPPLPQDASGQNLAAPGGAPNVTQEVSLSQIEAEVGKAGGAATQPPPRAPANTQQVSVADIEAEVEASQSAEGAATPPAPPTSTQQISTADIEEEVLNASDDAAEKPAVPDAPTTTQQISAVDIQAELDAGEGEAAEASAPDSEPTDSATGQAPPSSTTPPPTTTQQISAVDIQAEMDAASEASAKSDFSAPAHTQQVSLSDIEAEVKAATPPPAPVTSAEGDPEPPPLPETALPPGQAAEAAPDPQSAAGLAPPEGVAEDANAVENAEAAESATADDAATKEEAAAETPAAEEGSDAAAESAPSDESVEGDDGNASNSAPAAAASAQGDDASEPDSDEEAKADEKDAKDASAENGAQTGKPSDDDEESPPAIRPLPGPSGTPN